MFRLSLVQIGQECVTRLEAAGQVILSPVRFFRSSRPPESGADPGPPAIPFSRSPGSRTLVAPTPEGQDVATRDDREPHREP